MNDPTPTPRHGEALGPHPVPWWLASDAVPDPSWVPTSAAELAELRQEYREVRLRRACLGGIDAARELFLEAALEHSNRQRRWEEGAVLTVGYLLLGAAATGIDRAAWYLALGATLVLTGAAARLTRRHRVTAAVLDNLEQFTLRQLAIGIFVLRQNVQRVGPATYGRLINLPEQLDCASWGSHLPGCTHRAAFGLT